MERSLKGVILAGGSGTRLHPLTRITNKHLLPIYDRPMVTYAIEALVNAGVTELMLVTGGTHAGEFFRLLGNGHEYGIDRLFYAYQDRPGGIAEALGLAERFVARRPDRGHARRQRLRAVARARGRELPRPGARRRGSCSRTWTSPSTCATSASPNSTASASSGSSRSRPTRPASTPSPAIYFYDEQVWDVLPTLEPSGRGELEITDVNNWYVGEGQMEYDVLDGFWGDAGESIDAYYEVNDFVRATAPTRTRHGRRRPSDPAEALRGRARLVLGADARERRCRSRCARRTSSSRGRA